MSIAWSGLRDCPDLILVTRGQADLYNTDLQEHSCQIYGRYDVSAVNFYGIVQNLTRMQHSMRKV